MRELAEILYNLDLDTTAILVAGISAIATILGVFITSSVSKRANNVKKAVQTQKITDRLELIEAKLDVHNGYAERFAEIEKAVVAIRKDIEYISKNIQSQKKKNYTIAESDPIKKR